jgi:hypothetical protein
MYYKMTYVMHLGAYNQQHDKSLDPKSPFEGDFGLHVLEHKPELKSLSERLCL